MYRYAVPISTSESYGYGAYESAIRPVSTTDSTGLVSYARAYFAPYKSKKSNENLDGDKCAPAPESCPVCSEDINLEAIGKFCTFKSVLNASARKENTNEKGTSCSQLNIRDVIVGDDTKRNMRLSIGSGCSCPALENEEDVIILAPRSKIANKHIIADDEVFIVTKTESSLSDANELAQRCNA